MHSIDCIAINWRYEDLHRGGNNYGETLTPKKNLYDDLTNSKNEKLISFEIPIGVKSGNHGIVTCTENSCGDLVYKYQFCKSCGDMRRPNILDYIKEIP